MMMMRVRVRMVRMRMMVVMVMMMVLVMLVMNVLMMVVMMRKRMVMVVLKMRTRMVSMTALDNVCAVCLAFSVARVFLLVTFVGPAEGQPPGCEGKAEWDTIKCVQTGGDETGATDLLSPSVVPSDPVPSSPLGNH